MGYTIKDICTPRPKKDGGTYWHRIGTAFVSDDGKIGLQFDSLPIPDAEGKCAAQVFDRRDDTSSAPRRPRAGQAPARATADMPDEDIPF